MPFPKIDNVMLNTGSGIGQLLQLNSQGKLPNLDASLLTNLVSSQSGSAMVLIDTKIIPAGGINQIDFTTGINSTYKEYVVRGTEISTSNPGDVGLRVRIGGVFRNDNAYTWGGQVLSNDIGANNGGAAGDSYFPIVRTNNNINGPGTGVGFTLNITNPSGTLRNKAMHIIGGGSGANSNSGFSYYYGGAWTNGGGDYSPFDGLRILAMNNLINTGTFKLYGIL